MLNLTLRRIAFIALFVPMALFFIAFGFLIVFPGLTIVGWIAGAADPIGEAWEFATDGLGQEMVRRWPRRDDWRWQ